MKTATTHHAKTHLSQLLREVRAGETVVILHGEVPVATLTAVDHIPSKRPAVGTVTSEPVTCSDDAFSPMTDEQLAEWGL